MSRITVVTGAYGSGKSEFCAQLALRNAPCAIADMDVINPYFRVRERHAYLASFGVEVIDSSLGHQLNQDIPAISGAIGGYVRNPDKRLIIDLAGSENGLKALRLFDEVIKKQPYETVLVMNPFRIEMSFQEVKEMIVLFRETCHLEITGIVNNSNLLDATTLDDLKRGQEMIMQISRETGLPVAYTMIPASLQEGFMFYESKAILVEEWLLREDWMGEKYAKF